MRWKLLIDNHHNHVKGAPNNVKHTQQRPLSVNYVRPGFDPCCGGSSHIDACRASDGVYGTATTSRKGDCWR
ncbi:hypothetical protein VYU27_002329 [Nannochloropsis oceanica]